MVRRIFLALSIPDTVKEELLALKNQYPELPAKWTRKESLHVTLLFLGNMSEKEVDEFSKTVQEVAGKYKPFSFILSSIDPGPTTENVKMVWATGETPQELQALRDDLVKELQPIGVKPFSLHVTLARLKEWEYRRMEEDERPEIVGELSLEVPVSSIEIMESKLKRGGPEYTTIQSIPL